MRSFLALCLCAISLRVSPPGEASPPGEVIFSELMWMGSTASNADEWIELHNRSDRDIDLTGWTITRLTGGGEQPMLALERGVIGPGAVFLVANYSPDDERSRLAVAPDLVHAAVSLPNNRLQLSLYDGPPDQGGRLMDVADEGIGAPLAGDAQLKRAMVRVAFDQDGTLPTSWATAREASGWDAGATELGTPGKIPEYLLTGQTKDRTGTAAFPATWAGLKEKR